MNSYQLSKQFRYKLRALEWPDQEYSTGDVVFGSVHVTNGVPEEQYPFMKFPAILIAVNEADSDEQKPDYLKQTFTLTYVAQVAGDLRGEGVLLGANRVGAALSSKGRGLLEIEEEVSRLVRQIQEDTGVKILSRRRSTVGVGVIDNMGYVAARSMVIEARCTDARYYHPPQRVRLASTKDNRVTVTWEDPPDRYDGVGRSIYVRYLVGDTPPTSINDGLSAGSVARGVQSLAHDAGSGVRSYSVFAAYTDTGAAADERYSEGPVTEDGVSATITV